MIQRISGVLALLAILFIAPIGRGDDEEAKPKFKKFEPPAEAKRLDKKAAVWLDAKKKQIIVDGEVSLTKGPLEMFACSKGTKEHESVVAVYSSAQIVHAGLLAIGAKQGKPVQFQPHYARATGQIIDITVQWFDKEGKLQSKPAREWVRYEKTKKPLNFDWVFAGSGFWTDKRGVSHYQADSGDLICVSNFPTAMLDLPVESSQANDGLLFEANGDTIPLRGTPVRLILHPRPPKKGEPVKTTKPSDTNEVDPFKKDDKEKTKE